jgi:hypothetical protein
MAHRKSNDAKLKWVVLVPEHLVLSMQGITIHVSSEAVVRQQLFPIFDLNKSPLKASSQIL